MKKIVNKGITSAPLSLPIKEYLSMEYSEEPKQKKKPKPTSPENRLAKGFLSLPSKEYTSLNMHECDKEEKKQQRIEKVKQTKENVKGEKKSQKENAKKVKEDLQNQKDNIKKPKQNKKSIAEDESKVHVVTKMESNKDEKPKKTKTNKENEAHSNKKNESRSRSTRTSETKSPITQKAREEAEIQKVTKLSKFVRPMLDKEVSDTEDGEGLFEVLKANRNFILIAIAIAAVAFIVIIVVTIAATQPDESLTTTTGHRRPNWETILYTISENIRFQSNSMIINDTNDVNTDTDQ